MVYLPLEATDTVIPLGAVSTVVLTAAEKGFQGTHAANTYILMSKSIVCLAAMKRLISLDFISPVLGRSASCLAVARTIHRPYPCSDEVYHLWSNLVIFPGFG